MTERILGGGSARAVVFGEADGRLWVRRLFGMACANEGEETGPTHTQGPAVLCGSLGRFEDGDFALTESEFKDYSARIVWQAGSGGLCIESRWDLDVDTGVLRRRDRLVNAGAGPAVITRCLARFVFSLGHYEVYSQDSRWSMENQGAWRPVEKGSVTLGHEWGRTTLGGTPYAVVRERDGDAGVAFHLLPRSNWIIRLSARAYSRNASFLSVELGMSDEDLRRELPPGAALDMSEILIQHVPMAKPHLAAPSLHRYTQKSYFRDAKPSLPVVYNTWFDRFADLDVPRLRRQLAAAKEVGCETFVVDAGWYGPGISGWGGGVGDWREKTDTAFHGRMSEFADEVRATGLNFGLWMEPERYAFHAPIRSEHAEWFIEDVPRTKSRKARLYIEKPEAYAYLSGEISRLVETYGLAWMKIDFNATLGYDASGSELSGYYERWYALLDEVRTRYPNTVFEGCASGGLRMDLESLRHHDQHFLSDSANPVDVIRIGEGALLRLPPGRIGRWAVLRSLAGEGGEGGPGSGEPWEQGIVTPGGATWAGLRAVNVDFAAMVAMMGVFGLSGDLTGLPIEARERLAGHVAFYKKWRGFIAKSVAHLLTPPKPISDRTGWAGVQLQGFEGETSLLFAFRLRGMQAARTFPLRGLKPDSTYRVRSVSASVEMDQPVRGGALMTDGIVVTLSKEDTAALYTVCPE